MKSLFAVTALMGIATAQLARIPAYDPMTHPYGFEIYCMIYNNGGDIGACNQQFGNPASKAPAPAPVLDTEEESNGVGAAPAGNEEANAQRAAEEQAAKEARDKEALRLVYRGLYPFLHLDF